MRGNIPPSGGRPGRGCRTESHPSPRSTAPRKTGDFGAGAKPRAVCADENLRRPKPFSGRLRAHRAPPVRRLPEKPEILGAGGAKPRTVCADENLRIPKPFSGRLRAHRAPDEVEGVDRRARLDELLVPPEIPLVAENLAPRVQGDIGVPRNGG